VADPYASIKIQLNRMASQVVSRFKARLETAKDPLLTAVKLAIAGNVIDLGASDGVSRGDVMQSVNQVLAQGLGGNVERFRQAADQAQRILYLADNAGEIIFDRLLIDTLDPRRITVAVRGSAVINDATMTDAMAAGLHEICEVIDNGSDAPGTLLDDCSSVFCQQFNEADLIIAKGQGNFESLSEYEGNISFLFKVKCPVVATHTKLPIGTHTLLQSSPKL
jgi:damage-control phosphatase, subfamily I